ncbi:MAG: MFS transporter [Legionellaceae bacterium]|nr:MFS transporter [Legionellaceae bacterium]MBP9775581.1 MFS transporter [Legionellaceae bacterium]
MTKKLFIVLLLGFSSGLPISLVSSTLQAWFADAGLSIWLTSSLSLISLPYLFRFLWTPLLDRYRILSLGKRRGWICGMQILLIAGLHAITWFKPIVSPGIMAMLAFILAIFSATQDAAIDAHRIEYLPSEYYGLGASLASTGYRIGMLMSGGVALVIAQNYGWIVAYRAMSAALLVGVLAILWSPEPKKTTVTNSTVLDSFMAPVRDLLSRSGIFSFCIFILLFKLGEVFTTAISGIVMPFLIQGLGFSLATIGYVNKIWGTLALILGGVAGGVLMLRLNLYRALLYFGLLQAVTNLLFVFLAMAGKNIVLFSLAVISDNFAAGMGSTALVALIMRFVNQKFTATQFSILVCIAGLPRVFSGPMGAFLQIHYGWIGLYMIAFLLSFMFIPFLHKIKTKSL